MLASGMLQQQRRPDARRVAALVATVDGTAALQQPPVRRYRKKIPNERNGWSSLFNVSSILHAAMRSKAHNFDHSNFNASASQPYSCLPSSQPCSVSKHRQPVAL
jgi:hypothetical protein